MLVCCAAAQMNGPTEPLCRAAWQGDIARVRALLSGGANPNVRDESGQTPLMHAVSVIRRPVTDEPKPVKRAYHAVANLLLDKGADVSARDKAGRTPLLLAMEGSASEYKVIGADESMARLLVKRGASVNARDNEGWSPLLRVLNLWADQPGLIEFLLVEVGNPKIIGAHELLPGRWLLRRFSDPPQR